MLYILIILIIVFGFFLMRTIHALGIGLFVFVVLVLWYVVPSVGTAIHPVPSFSETMKLGIPQIKKEYRPLNDQMQIVQYVQINIESTYRNPHQATIACTLNNKPWFARTVNLVKATVQSNAFGFGDYTQYSAITPVLQTIKILKDWTDGDEPTVGCHLIP